MKKDLIISSIKKLQPALSDGGILETKGMIVFTGDHMVAYGQEVSVWVPFEFSVEEVIGLPWKEFNGVIQKIKNEEIDLVVEGSQILLTSGKTSAGFNTVKIEAPLPPKRMKWEKLPENFIEGLSFCVFSAGKDSSLGVLQGLRVFEDRIISTDRSRITEFHLKAKMSKEVILLREFASFLVKTKAKEYFVDASLNYFRDEEGTIFSQMIISDEFPDVGKFFDVSGEETKFPLDIIDALSRAGILADDQGNDYVNFSLSRSGIVIRGECKEKGWVEEKLPMRWKGGELKFVASATHFIEVMKITQKATVGENAILFEGDNFKHVIARAG